MPTNQPESREERRRKQQEQAFLRANPGSKLSSPAAAPIENQMSASNSGKKVRFDSETAFRLHDSGDPHKTTVSKKKL